MMKISRSLATRSLGMKKPEGDLRAGALIEILIVVGTLAALAALLVPRITLGRAQASRINCVCQLRELALEARVWSTEHDKAFTWQVSTNDKGSLEPAVAGCIDRVFVPMSKQRVSPSLLVCPSDKRRKAALSLQALTRENLSYFVALDASEDDAQMILFGDRNISGEGELPPNRILTVSPGAAAVWGEGLHVRAGNIALTDGSVQQVSDLGLQKQLGTQTNNVRFALP